MSQSEHNTVPRSAERRRSITLVGPLPPPYGGISVHISRLAAGLAEHGHRVRVIATGRSVVAESTEVLVAGNSAIRNYRCIRRVQSELVHIHHSLPILAAIACVTSRLAGAAVVVTKHGLPLSAFRRRTRVDLFWRLALQSAHAVIAVGPHVLQAISPFLSGKPSYVVPAFLPPSAAELIPPPGELSDWLRHRPRHEPLLTMAAYRVEPGFRDCPDVYGLSTVEELAHRLCRAGTRFGLAVMIAEAPTGVRHRRVLSAFRDGLSQRLGDAFRVFVSTPALPVIARSTVFLRPSRTDGDSVAVREALSLGIPVVASDAVSRPDGVTVYPLDDVAALERCVMQALTNVRPESASGSPQDQPNLLAIERVYEAAIHANVGRTAGVIHR